VTFAPDRGDRDFHHRYIVTPEQVDAYDRDGVVLLPGLAGPDWLERLRQGIERSLIDDKSAQPNAYFMRLRLWEHDPDLRAFCFESAVPEAAAQLMRTDKVNLLYDQAFVKEPSSNAPTPWHNDQPYWPVRGTEIVTLWVACDPVTSENGGLEFVRGSHRLNKWYRPWDVDDTGAIIKTFYGDEDQDFEDLPDIEGDRSRYDIVSWDMKPGDAVAFHGLMLHGAPGNRRPDLRRRAYSIRLTGRNIRYFAGKVWNTFITNPSLKNGDILDSPQYPVVFGK
jgi:ectoine hydroxylase-related dioxygenase (phytanoyl-CoA dioxygenase family)